MPRRLMTKGIGSTILKYIPLLAIVVAIYQYYKDAGGFSGFLEDIKHINVTALQNKWMDIAMGIALFVGADVVARFVPGKLRYVVKGVMYYLGAAKLLGVLQSMYVYSPPASSAGSSVVGRY